MVLKFRLSFYNKHGDRIDDLHVIKRTYLRTWYHFPLDALTAFPLEILALAFNGRYTNLAGSHVEVFCYFLLKMNLCHVTNRIAHKPERGLWWWSAPLDYGLRLLPRA